MSFAPYPNRAGFILLSVAIIGIIVAALLIQALLQTQTPAELFIRLLALLLVLALTGAAFYGALVAFNLDYYLNRNGLTIRWGLSRQLIPIHLIEKIIPGSELTSTPKFRGVTLGGLRWGRARAENGLLKFRTTAPLEQSLLVITPAHTYVISPQQPAAFIQARPRRLQVQGSRKRGRFKGQRR